jgi:hypothetical protein
MKALKGLVVFSLLLFPVHFAAAQFPARTVPSKDNAAACVSSVVPVLPTPSPALGTVFLLEYHVAFQHEEDCTSIPVHTFGQCMDACEALPECKAFSYVKAEEEKFFCLLLHDAGGKKVMNLNAISGMQWQN